ncbi:MAG: hypothetical protein KIS66_12110 [Fimbriimonadaceae bacterium]|nr:hypothetical protein [Fimbriimonadaceae bacterium]
MTWLLPVIALALIGLVVWGIVSENRRRAALEAYAQGRGWIFSREVPGDVWAAAQAFHPFGIGHSQRACNLLCGDAGEGRWFIFDYRYTTGSGKHQTTHHYGIALCAVPFSFPRVRIRRQHFGDDMAGWVGIRDLQFESDEFNRRYHVVADDPRFAYALIDPTMMEWLQAAEGFQVQIAGMWCAVNAAGRYGPMEIERIVGSTEEFFARVPRYVRQDYALSRPGGRV